MVIPIISYVVTLPSPVQNNRKVTFSMKPQWDGGGGMMNLCERSFFNIILTQRNVTLI